MFENGSYLRRRKRFKLMKKAHEDKSVDIERARKKMLGHVSSPPPPVKLPPVKSSFFIDNLLGNDANTNISYASSSVSSTSSEVTSPLQHLLYASDLSIVRKLTFLSDIKLQQQQQQQQSVFW